MRFIYIKKQSPKNLGCQSMSTGNLTHLQTKKISSLYQGNFFFLPARVFIGPYICDEIALKLSNFSLTVLLKNN